MPYVRPNPSGKTERAMSKSNKTVGEMKSTKPKRQAGQTPGLPTLEEFKQSAAYKNGGLTYKQYLEYFKARGAK